MDNTSVSNISGQEKVFAILAYVGFLWFLGMLNIIPSNVRESAYVKNHVNNGMTLFICCAILACIPFVGWFVEIGVVVLAIMGIVAAATNKYYTIPLIGEKIKLYW